MRRNKRLHSLGKGIYLYFLESFDERINGYKTFRDTLIKAFSEIPDLHISVIVEDSPVGKVSRVISDGIEYISFPLIEEGRFDTLENLFRMEISKHRHMVFLSNFSPSIYNAYVVKKLFPDAVFIHVVHDLPWLLHLNGDVRLYERWLNDDDFTFDDVTEHFLRYSGYDTLKTAAYADRIVCLCETTYDVFKDIYGISEDKLTILPNGLYDKSLNTDDLTKNKYRQKYGIPEGPLVVLLVGRLCVAKGADRINRLIGKIRFDQPTCLVYVGEDDISQWIEESCGLQVLSLGKRDRDEIFEIYSTADFGLLTSRYEQCSYVGIEMMMAGIAVITTHSYGLSDMFDAENAIIVNEHYEEVRELNDIDRIRSNGRLRYIRRYSINNMVDGWIRIISESCNQHLKGG